MAFMEPREKCRCYSMIIFFQYIFDHFGNDQSHSPGKSMPIKSSEPVRGNSLQLLLVL